MIVDEIISRKSQGKTLDKRDIDTLIDAYSRDIASDAQMTKFLKGVFEHGMTLAETSELTRAMAASGATVDLSCVKPPRVDKHSTGGVGDKTTLIVAPLAAAAGMSVAKMSGRSLGHTGGTIDKLESIPGMRLDLTVDDFIEQVKTTGLAICCQTADMVPADKKLYALRDRTGMIASIPLIAASVMSKKLASGADFIVLDIKTGSGAFMRKFSDAKSLAETCVAIGKEAGKMVVGVISQMDQPLGRTVGNALEVKEAIETLQGNSSADLLEISKELSVQLLLMTGLSVNRGDAEMLIDAEIGSGQALEKLADMVEAQGGDRNAVLDTSILPRAAHIEPLNSELDGYVHEMDTMSIGLAAKKVFGLNIHKKIGDKVKKGELLAEIHADCHPNAKAIKKSLLEAYFISESPATPPPLILSIVR